MIAINGTNLNTHNTVNEIGSEKEDVGFQKDRDD